MIKLFFSGSYDEILACFVVPLLKTIRLFSTFSPCEGYFVPFQYIETLQGKIAPFVFQKSLLR